MNRIYISSLGLLVLLLLPAELLARVIVPNGNVRDPQGKVLPGASIEVFEHLTGRKARARSTSGDDGRLQVQAPSAETARLVARGRARSAN